MLQPIQHQVRPCFCVFFIFSQTVTMTTLGEQLRFSFNPM